LASANKEARVLITKEADFELSHELGHRPPKLLLLTSGNIHNDELLELFAQHGETYLRLLEQHTFLELSWRQLIVHK
jgi:predicted nuclease of predicted toxin-antitoxin system